MKRFLTITSLLVLIITLVSACGGAPETTSKGAHLDSMGTVIDSMATSVTDSTAKPKVNN